MPSVGLFNQSAEDRCPLPLFIYMIVDMVTKELLPKFGTISLTISFEKDYNREKKGGR